MSNIACPSCSSTIDVNDINIAEGVALCRGCNQLHRLSDIAESHDAPTDAELDQIADGKPPAGCAVKDNGVETRLTASTRAPTAFFMWFFTLFWNSITGIFLSQAVLSILTHLGAIPNGWSPPWGGTGSFGSIPLPMAIGLLIFLVPFILVGCLTFGMAATMTAGRVLVILKGDHARIRTGVGPLSWGSTFQASAVRSVNIRNAGSSTNGKPDRHIVIDGDEKTIKFGSMLSPARKRWLTAALRELLVPAPR